MEKSFTKEDSTLSSSLQQTCFQLNSKMSVAAMENMTEEYSKVLLSRYEHSLSSLLPVLSQDTRNQNQQATFFTNKSDFTSYTYLLPPEEIKQQISWPESNPVFLKKEIEGPIVKKTKLTEPSNTAVPTTPRYLVTPPEEKVPLKKREPIKDTSYINYGDNREEEEEGGPEELQTTAQTPFITARQKLDKDNETKNGGNTNNKASLSKTTKSSVGGGKRKFVTPFKDKQEEEEPPKQQNKKSNQNSNTKEKNPLLNDERLKGCEEAMVEMICNDIIDKSPCISWNDIAGLEHAKSTVHEMIIYPLLRPDIFTGIRAPPKGLLLFGPPGTGKTMIGKAIASESKSTFFSISASSLTSKWIGEGEKMVRTMFAVARCLQPVVIFIDEIDSLLTQRSDNENEASRRIKTEFLIQLDGAGNGAEERLLLIGATNRPQELDEAARRRLVKKLYIPLPELSARVALLKSLLSKCSHSLSESEIHNVAVKCEGYSGADLKSLAQEAALYAVREEANILEVSSLRPVNETDFLKAIRHTKPSVSQDSLKQYEDWNKQFGSFV